MPGLQPVLSTPGRTHTSTIATSLLATISGTGLARPDDAADAGQLLAPPLEDALLILVHLRDVG